MKEGEGLGQKEKRKVMIKHNKKKMTKGTIKSMEEKGDE
jgi:hypothetical protein